MSFKLRRPTGLAHVVVGGDQELNKAPANSPINASSGKSSLVEKSSSITSRFNLFSRSRNHTASEGSFSTSDSSFFKTGALDDDGGDTFEFSMVNGKVEAREPREPRVSAIAIDNPMTHQPAPAPGNTPDGNDFIFRQSNLTKHRVPDLLRKLNDDYAADFEWPSDVKERPKSENADEEETFDLPPEAIDTYVAPKTLHTEELPPPPFPDLLILEDPDEA